MNIFATGPDPYYCALALDDRRLVKMTLETAQLLSTACHLSSWVSPLVDPGIIYRPAFPKHPVTIWVGRNPPNFVWARQHFVFLLAEYTHRFDKRHASADLLTAFFVAVRKEQLPPTEFCNCTPFKTDHVFDDYRRTLHRKWTADAQNHAPPFWTKRGPPAWASRRFRFQIGDSGASNKL